MPQEKLHLMPTGRVHAGIAMSNKENPVIENEFVSTEKYFGDAIADSENVESVDMAFHAGAEWFTSIEKNDQLYVILDKGIRLRVLLNYPDVSETVAKHMRHKRKQYMKFEECIQHWQELSNEYPDTVEIRIADIPVLRRYYSFHMKDVRKDTVNVKYYTYGNARPDKNYQPIFRRDSAYFELYRMEFDYLWNRAAALDEDRTNPPGRKHKTTDTVTFFTDGMSRITDVQQIDMFFRRGSEWHLNSNVVELLSRIFDKGIKMRVIINEKEVVEETAKHMGHNLRKYYGYDQNAANWVELSKKYPELVSVHIAEVPLMRRYYNNIGTENGLMKVSYYTYGNPYPDQDCQTVIEASDSIYKLYSNEFEYLWNSGSHEI